MAGRNSGSSPYLRRVARSLSKFDRSIPMFGANSLLLRNVPFLTNRVPYPLTLSALCQRWLRKVRVVSAPGAIGVSKR